MQTSRFQLGLIATLAVGLGFSLASSDAVGYPAEAISKGTNPVFSVGGHPGSSDTSTVLTAPLDQAAIVTDVAVTASGYNVGLPCVSTVTLLDPDGTSSAAYRVVSNASPYTSSWGPTSVVQSFSSGVAVAPGDTLRVSVDGNCTVSYTLSGYYAQP